MKCKIVGVCDSANSVMEKQRIKHSNILYVFEGCGEEKEGSKSFEAHTQGKGKQQQSNLEK